METDSLQLQRASNATLASLLNLTLFPVIGFIVLLLIYKKTTENSYARYYCVVAIKINLFAAVALFLVSALIIFVGGLTSPWTWVYVVSYFVLGHALFILAATWTMVRSWTGEKLKKSFLSK
ncbi:MAG: hypothetical protein COA90_08315 [Gammaproteobacteria bacterium]|nr:MAG: hypothetical protein COA90_08315 [Gammaproteobacteria bacterium]